MRSKPLAAIAAVAMLLGGAGPRAGATTEPPDSTSPATAADNCLPRPTVPEHTALIAGETDDGARWVAGFGVDDRGIQMVCVDITYRGGDAASGRIGGPFPAGADDSEVVVGVMSAGYRDGPRWLVIRGTVTAAAERVSLSIAGADPVDAVLANVGPEDGWRWFALALPAGDVSNPHVAATAFDAEHEQVAAGESPF